jgi:hypothetical protein
MLDICCNVGSSFDLSFNPANCLCGMFGTRYVKTSSFSVYI